jgi:hypothetical protein
MSVVADGIMGRLDRTPTAEGYLVVKVTAASDLFTGSESIEVQMDPKPGTGGTAQAFSGTFDLMVDGGRQAGFKMTAGPVAVAAAAAATASAADDFTFTVAVNSGSADPVKQTVDLYD